MSHLTEFNFAGARGVILHPGGTVRDRIAARCAAVGISVELRWPTLGAEDDAADFLIVDMDMGCDEQLRWAPGAAPMPIIGLIGSESPGRLDWALRNRFDAFLPLTATGSIFSALVIAHAKFRERCAMSEQNAETARRASLRLPLIRAVLAIMEREGVGEKQALKRLRAFAMVEQLPLEDAAQVLIEQEFRDVREERN
ncbi:MAG: ANTAR domain-containing protein [Paracoccaceae bacterium]